MPTATGLPKAGDYIYNAHFRTRFRIMRRNGNSYPMSLFLRPMPGREYPVGMASRASGNMQPDGTYRLLLEADVDTMFRMGLSQWVMLPQANEVPKQRCSEHSASHAPHLWLRQRAWYYCNGVKEGSSVKTPAPPAKRVGTVKRPVQPDVTDRVTELEGRVRELEAMVRKLRALAEE